MAVEGFVHEFRRAGIRTLNPKPVFHGYEGFGVRQKLELCSDRGRTDMGSSEKLGSLLGYKMP